uniref:hypothetical protein n=1 Tax=uncultured Flavonifractor sp. TaxID=1193534 RepID=UPI00262CF9DE
RLKEGAKQYGNRITLNKKTGGANNHGCPPTGKNVSSGRLLWKEHDWIFLLNANNATREN